MQSLTNQSEAFDLERQITYLNGAFMSPQLKSVTAAGVKALTKKARPYNIGIDDFFADTEEIRKQYSKLIGNPETNRIVIIPSVSYGMANVAKNIDVREKEIIVVGEQFPSNVYPWHTVAKDQGGKVVTIDPPSQMSNRAEEWNKQVLSSITERTAAVAISQVHWADGTLFDLVSIRKRTREVGALLIIDGTQSVGAMPFNVSEIDPDALICAGYKWLLGPYGIGVAYYGSHFDTGRPIEENWINRKHSENFAGLVEYESSYQPGALRYEVGEHSNFILVPMFLEALKQLNEWQPARIQHFCKNIGATAIDELRKAGYFIEADKWRAHHLFGIRHESMPVEKIKKVLSDKNIAVSYRGTAIRVSPYVHNTEAQMNILAESLMEIIEYA